MADAVPNSSEAIRERSGVVASLLAQKGEMLLQFCHGSLGSLDWRLTTLVAEDSDCSQSMVTLHFMSSEENLFKRGRFYQPRLPSLKILRISPSLIAILKISLHNSSTVAVSAQRRSSASAEPVSGNLWIIIFKRYNIQNKSCGYSFSRVSSAHECDIQTGGHDDSEEGRAMLSNSLNVYRLLQILTVSFVGAAPLQFNVFLFEYSHCTKFFFLDRIVYVKPSKHSFFPPRAVEINSMCQNPNLPHVLINKKIDLFCVARMTFRQFI